MKKSSFVKGLKIDSVQTSTLASFLNDEINSNTRNYISITNTEAMYLGSRNYEHFKYINKSYLSLCDGVGIVLAAKFNGIKINRYNGPDFFMDVISSGQKHGWTHYFLGGKPGIAEKLINEVTDLYPKTKVLGSYSPPFRELSNEEELKMINDINVLKPNFLWVSLGLPKQEKWISKYKDQIESNFLTGVGAAFDFHTGNVKRAPSFFQKIGLEWFYRTLFERRLIVRQIRGFKFMFEAIVNNKSNFK